MRRARDVAVTLGAPHVIAGSNLALVVDETALDDEGLLDLDMFMEGQLGARPPAEERGHQPGFRFFEQDFHVDAGARRRLPRQAVDLDITRSHRPEIFGASKKGRVSRHRFPPSGFEDPKPKFARPAGWTDRLG